MQGINGVTITMNQSEKIVHEMRAQGIVKNLKKRNMNGYYFENVEAGIEKVLHLIPEGAVVGLGGSTTVIESGLLDRLRAHPIELLDRYRERLSREQVDEIRERSLLADVLVTSTNAITLRGQIVNVDGMGNRVAAMLYGPAMVIIFAGINKIVENVEAGIARVHSIVAPANVQRLGSNPPCSETGICDEENCFPPERMCNKYVIIEGEYDPNRLHVVLVGERLGF